jgi:hypothetical protein
MEFMLIRVAVFLRKARTILGNLRHLVAPNKVALEDVAVPTREHKGLAIVAQYLLGELRHIIPTIGNIEGEVLTVHIRAVRVNDADLVFGDGGSVHAKQSEDFL